MENFRSMSCKEGRNNNNNMNSNNGVPPPTSMQDLRSFSTSYVHPQPSSTYPTKDGKSSSYTSNRSSSYKMSKGGGLSSSMKGWSLSDPEIQRKKRVVSYKVYAVEGKMKGSFRKSFRWVKNTCSNVVHGLW